LGRRREPEAAEDELRAMSFPMEHIAQVVLSLALTAAAAQGLDPWICASPREASPTHPTAVDYSNPRAQSDYHLLVLLWREPHAAARVSEGRFVLGALMPRSRKALTERDHPRHCIPPMLLSAVTLRRYSCLFVDGQALQDAWVRYGGCAFSNPREYYDRIAELWRRTRKPGLAALSARTGGWMAAGQIREAFVACNRASGLDIRQVIVTAGAMARLQDVRICYDEQFELTACPEDGTADTAKLWLGSTVRPLSTTHGSVQGRLSASPQTSWQPTRRCQ
jgi:ribonuclease I